MPFVVRESGEYLELTAGHWLYYCLVLMGRRGSDKVAIHIAQPARLGQRARLAHDFERLGQPKAQSSAEGRRTDQDDLHYSPTFAARNFRSATGVQFTPRVTSES